MNQVAGAAGGQSLMGQLLLWDLARTLRSLDRYNERYGIVVLCEGCVLGSLIKLS